MKRKAYTARKPRNSKRGGRRSKVRGSSKAFMNSKQWEPKGYNWNNYKPK